MLAGSQLPSPSASRKGAGLIPPAGPRAIIGIGLVWAALWMVIVPCTGGAGNRPPRPAPDETIRRGDAGDVSNPPSQRVPTRKNGESSLPGDSFQRCATKALRGDYGPLEPWQREAYRRGLRMGLTACWRLVLTQYNSQEGRSGRVDRYGRPCGPHTAASNLIPQGYIIWTPRTGLRVVCDCGARRNDIRCARLGGIWVDAWFPTAAAARAAGIDGWVRTRAAIIPPGPRADEEGKRE